jgi:PIN domain-containing protein
MKDLFPGYYRPTKEQFLQMWKECIFSFDASALLNVYRYSPKTREELFNIFQYLRDRTWLVHQALLDFHENREEVIAQQYTIYMDVEDPLHEFSEKIAKKYRHRGHWGRATLSGGRA